MKPRVRTRGFSASKCVSSERSSERVVNRALKTYQNSSFGVSRRVSCERVVDRGLIFFLILFYFLFDPFLFSF